MAQVEPMDIDAIDSDFDNKENSYHHSNVLSRTPCTEKGYEELDVSELNMKLRYSFTPASSPMSKSLTGCLDNRNCNQGEDYLNAVTTDNGNLSRSLHSTFNVTDSKKSKVLPLQTLSSDPFVDSNRNTSMRRLIEPDDNNIMISVSTNNVDDNLSLPSTSSSMAQTPEATTPTKDIPKPEGSPILRGLKSVLSMFRPSQSPIPPADDKELKQDNMLSPIDSQLAGHVNESNAESVRASTPVDVSKQTEVNSSKRNSPLKESLVFNDDLERELQWKDETTIIFKHEKIPLHKLLFKTPEESKKVVAEHINTTVEYMDISCNESILADKTMADEEALKNSHKNEGAAAVESDNEFLDCETTFAKNESEVSDIKDLLVSPSGKITVQSSENLEVTEIKDVNTTQIVEADNVNLDYLKDTSGTGSPTEIGNTPSNIIEVTTDFLKMETCNERLNLSMLPNQNRDQLICYDIQQQNLSITKDDNQIKALINDSVTKNQDNLNDLKIINLISTEVVTNKLEDMSDVYPVTLNEIENLVETVSLTTDMNKTEDNIEPMLPNEVNKCNSACGIASNSIVANELMTDNQEQMMHNTINPPKLNLEVNKEIVGDSQILVDKNTIEVSSSTMSKIIGNSKEVVTDLKRKENIAIEYSKNAPQKAIHVIESNLSVNMSDSNLLKNVGVTDVVKQVEDNNSLGISNNDSTVYINGEKVHDSKICEGNNTISQDNNIINTFNIPELALKGDIIGKLPQEIPLPANDDDIEKQILETNNFTEEVVGNQNVTFEINKENLNMHVENNTDSTDEFIYNPVQECNKTFLDETNKAENCNTHFEHRANNECENEINILKQGENKIDSEIYSFESTSQVLISEIQNVQDDIQNEKHLSEELANIQEAITINADDFGTQNAQIVGETIEIHTENQDAVSNFDIDTEVVSSISQENLIQNLVESPKVDIHMSCIKESSVEKFEYSVNNYQQKTTRETDEEIITSANNSPYVSVTELTIDIQTHPPNPTEEIDNSIITQTKITESPPISPKIVSKGYNFNFDEIDDPFATKTKIRMSPAPESFNTSTILEEDIKKTEESSKKINSNRRKSQPDRKRPTQKKNLNSTVVGHSGTNENASKKNNKKQNVNLLNDNITKPQTSSDLKPNPENNKTNAVAISVGVTAQSENQDITGVVETATLSPYLNDPSIQKEDILPMDGIKSLEQTLVISDQKSTSSSEQYFSLGTSSGESVGLMNRSKNVFNIPEIDDVNFNPFASKSKMRMSPPPSESKVIGEEEINNAKTNSSFVLQQKDAKESDIGDLMFNAVVTKDSSPNVGNVTSSSKDTNDKDTTVCEILTEDEDTIEGPFLEADDLKDIEKLNEGVANDMMNFDEVPAQEIDENLENGELFIDADAFEFLLNQNKSTTVLDSGKESLFLKFDPLFAKRVSSDGLLAALSKVQKRQSTPKKPSTNLQPNANIPVAGPSNDRENNVPVEEYSDDLSSSAMTKPMMVVNPAVSSIISQRKVAATPKLNRRSLTFTSPAMAVIDRLLSLSGNAPHLNDDTSSFDVSREHNETDFAITQLRELLAEKEIHVHNLRCESKELKNRLTALEVQVKSLETESAERLKKINDLNERLSEKTKINKSMATVVEEYERTIASLIAESEQDKKRHAEERIRLIKERDEQTAHLTSMEVSFSDLHSKYEKSKQIILTCKANEDAYKKSIKEFEDNFSKMQKNYELLKQHATSKLNHANQELEKMNRAHEAEVLKLNALIKRKELDITSLEESLSQKTKANEELTAICDELINKVG